MTLIVMLSYWNQNLPCHPWLGLFQRESIMSIFKSSSSFFKFVDNHKNEFRFIKHDEQKEFIESIRQYSLINIETVKKDAVLFRSQKENETEPYEIDGVHVYDISRPCSESRLIPNPSLISEGRINPKGIAYFYCSNSKETALAESRPWIGEYISLGFFKTVKDLRLVNFISTGKFPFYLDGVVPDEKLDEYIWMHISQLFSTPVSRDDDIVTYSVTQLISEIIKSEGFDGIAYQSLLHDGVNICLFSLESVEFTQSQLFDTTGIKYNFDEVPYGTPE